MAQKYKKIGLAISGGYIRPSAAIGVIEVLRQNGIPIDMVSGCSAGSAVAAAYASGTLEKLKQRLTLGTRREYWHVIFEPTMPKNGFLKGQRTLEFFKEFSGIREFSEMSIPLFLAATDLNRMQPVILNEGMVAEAVRSCVSVPGLFVPVKNGDMLLADGAHFNQIPSQVLYDNGADYVIAIDVSHVPNFITRSLAKVRKMFGGNITVLPKAKVQPSTKHPSIFELVKRALILSSQNIDFFHYSAYKFDILIKPDISGVKRWSVKKVEHLIKQGRQAAIEALPQIRKDLGLTKF